MVKALDKKSQYWVILSGFRTAAAWKKAGRNCGAAGRNREWVYLRAKRGVKCKSWAAPRPLHLFGDPELHGWDVQLCAAICRGVWKIGVNPARQPKMSDRLGEKKNHLLQHEILNPQCIYATAKEWAAYPVYITPEEANSSKESFKTQIGKSLKHPKEQQPGMKSQRGKKGGVSINSIIYAGKVFCAEGRGGTFVFWVPQSNLNGLIN